MTFTEYLKDRYRIDDIDKITSIYSRIIDIDQIINTGVGLSAEDAISYYQNNYNILSYYYLLFPDKYNTVISQEIHMKFIFPQCDYFYYTKKYYHLLISCLYNNKIVLTNDDFKYSCLHLNDNERDIILNILNRRNMVEHIAILLDTKPTGGDRYNFDL